MRFAINRTIELNTKTIMNVGLMSLLLAAVYFALGLYVQSNPSMVAPLYSQTLHALNLSFETWAVIGVGATIAVGELKPERFSPNPFLAITNTRPYIHLIRPEPLPEEVAKLEYLPHKKLVKVATDLLARNKTLDHELRREKSLNNALTDAIKDVNYTNRLLATIVEEDRTS